MENPTPYCSYHYKYIGYDFFDVTNNRHVTRLDMYSRVLRKLFNKKSRQLNLTETEAEILSNYLNNILERENLELIDRDGWCNGQMIVDM